MPAVVVLAQLNHQVLRMFFFLHVTLSYHERMQEYKTIFIQSGKTSSVLTSPPFFLFNYQENCMSNYVLEISFFLFTFQFRAAVIS